MSLLDKNRELCTQMMREDPFNAPKWEMVKRWANKDCYRDLIVGYPLEDERWWKEIGEWISIEERDMPVLKVVAGTLQVCGDPRDEQLMKVVERDHPGHSHKEILELFYLTELSEVWEEIIMGAEKLVESGWTPPVTDAPLPDPAPPPRKGGRPANPAREKCFKMMAQEMWDAQLNRSEMVRNFLRRHPEARQLFNDKDNLRTQFLNWLQKKT